MTTFTLTDERYAHDPIEFSTYEEMIDAIKDVCDKNGWEVELGGLSYDEAEG